MIMLDYKERAGVKILGKINYVACERFVKKINTIYTDEFCSVRL